MIRKKLAMLGMWGVGKTSLVRRYVHSSYDDKYQATLGVTLEKKVLNLGTQTITMVLWDIAGAENNFSVPLHYVRGAAGYMLVIDGTRRSSLTGAIELSNTVKDGIGEIPFVTLINKSDLEWEITPADIETYLRPLGCEIFHSSAKTGAQVEAAFTSLAQAMSLSV